jgi:hypothetical protein
MGLAGLGSNHRKYPVWFFIGFYRIHYRQRSSPLNIDTKINIAD